VVNIPGRGLSISSLGAVLAPQEFDGAKVVEVVPGGVAEMASLKPGDLIKSVDGKAVRTPMELAAELSDKSGKVHLGMQRGDFQTETVILLGTR
jgi:S1-C subfamily serine protease